MNKRNGSTECRVGTASNWSGWSAATVPFGAGADGDYSLDCAGWAGGANFPLCCRTGATGDTVCAVSTTNGALNWVLSPSPW